MAGASAMSTIASTALISGCSLKISDRSSLKCRSMNLFVNPTGSKKAAVTANGRMSACQAILSGDNGRPSSTSLLIGGFLLGGIVIGSLGCIYAPQSFHSLKLHLIWKILFFRTCYESPAILTLDEQRRRCKATGVNHLVQRSFNKRRHRKLNHPAPMKGVGRPPFKSWGIYNPGTPDD